ncbi:uncharacterized protein LOC111102109 [Crassostrea virginica]
MAMPCNKAGECVALEVFERKGGRDEIGQGETKTTKESIVCCASWPVNLQEDESNDQGDETDGTTQPSNQFTASRNFVLELCDASLLAANVSQLRAVLDNGPGNSYFIPLLIMINLSIVCHVAFVILKIKSWTKGREAQMKHSKHSKNNKRATTPQSQASTVNPQEVFCPCTPCMEVERYDEISMYFMFLVVTLNVGIAGLGLS